MVHTHPAMSTDASCIFLGLLIIIGLYHDAASLMFGSPTKFNACFNKTCGEGETCQHLGDWRYQCLCETDNKPTGLPGSGCDPDRTYYLYYRKRGISRREHWIITPEIRKFLDKGFNITDADLDDLSANITKLLEEEETQKQLKEEKLKEEEARKKLMEKRLKVEESEETEALTTRQLERLALLEQLQLTRLERKYYYTKLVLQNVTVDNDCSITYEEY